jgi:hypothetical protein
MRRLALLCSGILFVACTKAETPPPDTGMAAMPEPAAPAAAPISLSEVAGKYAVIGKNEAGDSTLVTYELTATGDTTGWTITFPKRKPIPVRIVSVSGDSIVAESGPYTSAIRPGINVTTHTVYHLENGKLMGRTVAHYETKGPDTVRIVVSEGVKK